MKTVNEQQARRTVPVRIAMPYGGDKAVARSIANIHRSKSWTGNCAGCGERYPCRDAADAQRVLAS